MGWEYFTHLFSYTVSTTDYDPLSIPSSNNVVVHTGNNPCIMTSIDGNFDNRIDLNSNSYIRIFGGKQELKRYVVVDGLSMVEDTSWPGGGVYLNVDMFILINEETQRARFAAYYQQITSGTQYTTVMYDSANDDRRARFYRILKSLVNWQAVPSIVGKSAVSLDLSVILDINNGEAVTTSDASKFDLNNDSNVITLVNNVINQNE